MRDHQMDNDPGVPLLERANGSGTPTMANLGLSSMADVVAELCQRHPERYPKLEPLSPEEAAKQERLQREEENQ
jgi:hypothetical protein